MRDDIERAPADLERTVRETEATDRTAEEMRALARKATLLSPMYPPALTRFWLADAVAGSAPP